MSDIQPIIGKYLDDRDSLSDEELAALVNALHESPELAEQLRDQLILDDFLGQRFAVDRQNFAAQVAQRIRDLDAGVPQRGSGEEDPLTELDRWRSLAAKELFQANRRAHHARLVKFWTAAAGLLLVAGVTVWYAWSLSTSRNIALVHAIRGDATRIRSGAEQPVAAGSRVMPGDRFVTSSQASMTVRYSDGSLLQIGGDASIGLGTGEATNGSPHEGKRVFVERGALSAKVVRQSSDRPMVLDTPGAEAKVLGTELSLRVKLDETRLEVVEGRVRLTRKSDRASVVVQSGQFTVVGPHKPLLPMPIPTCPGRAWTAKQPAEVGLDAEKLRAFSQYVGGRGCVVRYGYLVHSWGDVSKRADVASACKPLYSHFLFKAVEDGKIAGLDEKVVKWEPRLENINKDLAYKDRQITWRHLANQVSCYGVQETPGKAFDYSSYNMALLFDTLFLKVYGATYETVDEEVLHPSLTDVLQCEDDPTFIVFGTKDRPGRLGISVRDFARFGLLYLRQGDWRGQQLISPEHATMAVTGPVPDCVPRTGGKRAEMISGQRSDGGGDINITDHLGSYSFAWWINGVDCQGNLHWPDVSKDAYGAFVPGHPCAMAVIPSLDLVASWNDAKVQKRASINEALKLLFKACATEGNKSGQR